MPEIFDKLLVSCPNKGGLFLLHEGEVYAVDNIDTTGLEADQGVLFRGEQPDRLSGFHNGIVVQGERIDDIHDIVATDKGVYAVSTMGNRIVCLDREGNEIGQWQWEGEPDSRHINCVAYWQGRILYSAFGDSRSHRGYKGHTKGTGVIKWLDTDTAFVEGLSQPHSLLPMGDKLIVANSQALEIRQYDANGELLRSLSLGGYTRGVCLLDGRLYIGLSKSRNLEVSSTSSAEIVALDEKSWEELGRLQLPVDEIYSILAVENSSEMIRLLVNNGCQIQRRLNDASSCLAEKLEVAIKELEAERRKYQADLEAEQRRYQADLEAERNLYQTAQDQVQTMRDQVAIAEERALSFSKQRDEHAKLFMQVTQSLSWRVTRPMRFFMRLLRHGVVAGDRRRLESLLRPIYHQLPLPSVLRLKLGALYRRSVGKSAIRNASSTLPAFADIKLTQSLNGVPDYFVFGIIDWHFRHQRPQQLASQLAAGGRRTFYFSNQFIDTPEPGFSVEALDSEGRLFNVHLHLAGCPSIYVAPANATQLSQLRVGIGRLLEWIGSTRLVSLVQHPFWGPLASVLPDSKLVYDCMDHHEGFGGMSPELAAIERALFAATDLTITTSAWLDDMVAQLTRSRTIIRNAGEFSHFATPPVDIYRDKLGRKIIGYYGAIAEWFDVDLVSALASAFPECCLLLIGADTVGAGKQLASHRNVVLLGEIPYKALPHYAHAFDVCLLPFKVVPLTMATNPVKVYEYLSAGKPVVAVDLPEMQQFGNLCHVAQDTASFIESVRGALAEVGDQTLRERRQAFACKQTWAHRASTLIAQVESDSALPLTSIIVVTYNNLDLTQKCLASIDAHSHYENLEIIVVDNASIDGSPQWLEGWASTGKHRRLILNADNKGFAAGNNQGLAVARGEYLVLLNNDTFVTPGWVRTLMNHMRRDKTLGLLGPVTNNIGNEARIDIQYNDMAEMVLRAASYTRAHIGALFPLRTAAFFCVMMTRDTYERVGPLDEAFGRGFFEDDDYCRRVEQLGLRIACAEDVFVHHHLSASFNKLNQQVRQALFEENKKIYEAKWGKWLPHDYRSG